MKIAIFGGTFNPFHIGHAMLAEKVLIELGYDKVLLVPSYMPPHKNINSQIDPMHRLGMVKAFCEEYNGRIEVETCEIDRGGISYSYETVNYLSEKYKSVLDGKLGFVLGDEVAAEFHKWKNPELIAEKVDFIITRRYPGIDVMEKSIYGNNPNGSYKGDFGSKFDLKAFGYPCIYLSEPVLPVSSTEIRTKIGRNKSWRYLVSEAVFNYINQYGLYSGN